MKKVLLVLLMLLMFAGCSSNEVKGGDLDDINSRGYILVAMEGTWAPWTYHDENDALVGFDVEIGKYIADYIGVDVQYIEGEWDGLLTGVETGRYDMMINGCDITDKRKITYDFSDPYAFGRIAVIVNSDNEDIHSMEDLKGKKTANTITSVYADIAKEYGAEVEGVDDLNQTFLLLGNRRIDATINDEGSYGDYMKANPNAEFKIACYYGETTNIAIPMKKGSTALVAKVNEALQAAREDGTLSALSNKYFGIDITSK